MTQARAPQVQFRTLASSLVRRTLAVAILCTLVAATIQALLVARDERAAFNRALRNIADTHVPLLSVAVWDIEPEAIRRQLQRIAAEPEIAYVRLSEGTGHSFEAGNAQFRDSGAPLREPDYYQYDFDLRDVTEVWRRGSVIASWLLDLTAAALARDPSLSAFSGRVSDSGEGRWTLNAAIDEGVPAPVLSAALYQRFSSRGEADFENRVLSAMRFGFGGHLEKQGGSR